MKSVKQVIVWRNDLVCRTGKKMAQAALGDFSTLLRGNVDVNGNVSSFSLSDAQLQWYLGNFRKIVLKVNSEEDLLTIYNAAKALNLPVTLIEDSGLTEWKMPTKTCLSIGPYYDEDIDQVTGNNGPLGRLELM